MEEDIFDDDDYAEPVEQNEDDYVIDPDDSTNWTEGECGGFY